MLRHKLLASSPTTKSRKRRPGHLGFLLVAVAIVMFQTHRERERDSARARARARAREKRKDGWMDGRLEQRRTERPQVRCLKGYFRPVRILAQRDWQRQWKVVWRSGPRQQRPSPHKLLVSSPTRTKKSRTPQLRVFGLISSDLMIL